MSTNIKVLIVALTIWTAAAIREHVVKSHDPQTHVTNTIPSDTSAVRADTTGR